MALLRSKRRFHVVTYHKTGWTAGTNDWGGWIVEIVKVFLFLSKDISIYFISIYLQLYVFLVYFCFSFSLRLHFIAKYKLYRTNGSWMQSGCFFNPVVTRTNNNNSKISYARRQTSFRFLAGYINSFFFCFVLK